ncbi:hypothetical protein [Rhodococcus tibetensis]|uniref:Uncharacterized protein n=1 Tax=Rhodococcus tibetensis TaxID=2965064 RepID=A0ABT1Q5W2_9NOCA|nr:hypothetical protein [Rhodococcus sp. FXJ9.536]MCQ4117637.1 hypothetical protein [Rhodococcus sp. FXJ9.536]
MTSPHTDTVVVDGRTVVERGRVITVDEDVVAAEVERAHRALVRQAG